MSVATLPTNRCRICLNLIDNTVSAQSIADLKEKFLCVTGIVAHSEQPQVACLSCVTELENAYKFKKKCEETEKQLIQEKIKLEIALEDFVSMSTVQDLFKEVTEEAIKKEEEEEVFEEQKLEPKENQANISSKDSSKRTSSKNVQCELCGNFYLNFLSLKNHYLKLHNNRKPYSCEQCNQKFHIKAQLDIHKQKCNQLRLNLTKIQPDKKLQGNDFAACAICNNAFKIRYLKRHLAEVHGKQSKELTCDLCGEKYKGKPGLVEHMKRRHMSVQYECSFCKTIFPTSGMKRTHEIRYHTLKFSHHCGICNLKFINMVEYRNHFATHTGEKNYDCFHCGKQFARKQSKVFSSFVSTAFSN